MAELRLLGREHYELVEAFERDHHGRFDKEDKSLWPKGHVYQDGRVNELFVSFRLGYSFARAALASLQTQGCGRAAFSEQCADDSDASAGGSNAS